MASPQTGIIEPDRAHALFLIGRWRPRADPRQLRAGLRKLPSILREVAAIKPGAGLSFTVGFGSSLWDRLSPRRRPKGFRPFRAIRKRQRSAPATGGDLWLQIVSDRHDLNVEASMRLMAHLSPVIEVKEEIHGFRYLDSRDLTGFIDGTENPRGRDRAEAALIGPDDPRFRGGSYVAVQRYVHDLNRWRKLPVSRQEAIIGRTKRDSRELPDSRKPLTAHIRRVVIEEDGRELEILRHSYPYAVSGRRGLFFVAYTKDLTIFERMLSRMMGVAGDGLHDHLMDFTKPVTGATFFVPSREALSRLVR